MWGVSGSVHQEFLVLPRDIIKKIIVEVLTSKSLTIPASAGGGGRVGVSYNNFSYV